MKPFIISKLYGGDCSGLSQIAKFSIKGTGSIILLSKYDCLVFGNSGNHIQAKLDTIKTQYVTGFAKTRHNSARTEIHFIA